MPSVQLPGIQEYPNYEVVEESAPLYTDPNAIDTDYYPGGYDIESDFPPPPDDFPAPMSFHHYHLNTATSLSQYSHPETCQP